MYTYGVEQERVSTTVSVYILTAKQSEWEGGGVEKMKLNEPEDGNECCRTPDSKQGYVLTQLMDGVVNSLTCRTERTFDSSGLRSAELNFCVRGKETE